MDGAMQTVAESSVVENPSPETADPKLMPIGRSGVGNDPRYGDDFIAIKSEIDRLAESDYTEVVRLCERVLSEESKDLRIAGYYLLAKVFTEGLDGLLDGVELYLNLVRVYGSECHPQRESARLQAIAWLNNEKIVAFVNNTVITGDEKQIAVTRLKSQIDSLNSEIHSHYGEAATLWTALNPWVEKHLPKTSALAQAVPDKTKEEERPLSPVEPREIDSELAFTRSSEGLFSYLTKHSEWLRLVAMTRAMKWSSTNQPRHEEGITRLPPPRESIVTDVRRKIDEGISEERLGMLEAYFLEAGCQFFFDLQKHEVDVAKSLGENEIADLIEVQLRLLVQREPGIVRLAYSDGTPFANENTRRWIGKLGVGKISAGEGNPEFEDFNKKIEKIRAQAGASDLAASIKQLERLGTRDQAKVFHLELAKLDLCMDAQRYDIALPLAEQLEQQVERYRLYEWQRSLALEVWNKLLIILKQEKSGEQQGLLRIEELKGRICSTDLEYALSLF